MRSTRRPVPPLDPHRASTRGAAGKPRELSITTLFRPSTRTRSGETAVPYLRLSGHWLEQHGFNRGSRVIVTAENGKLILTIAPPRASVRPAHPERASTGAPSPQIT